MRKKIVSAFALTGALTIIESTAGTLANLRQIFDAKHIEFSDDCNATELKCALIHSMIWTVPYKLDGYAYGYLDVHTYSRSPCIILDIAASGKALVAVILLPSTVEAMMTPQVKKSTCRREQIMKKIGYQPDDASLPCQLFQQRPIFN
jgi:hypothetical protein